MKRSSFQLSSVVVSGVALVWAMIGPGVPAAMAQAPPFVLANDPAFEASTYIHTGNGYINEVVHPDVLYFPDGWGNVDGASFTYWMGITGYATEKHEQPCILVSNSISNDTWQEPAANAYDTNPISGYAWPTNNNPNGHYSDIDLVFNDDTGEIWAYFRNKSRTDNWERIELYSSADGVTWEMVSQHVLDAPAGAYLMSPTVVKEGDDWWLWLVDASSYSPNHLLRYHSGDGINYTFDHDCGYSFTTTTSRDPWHIEIVKYNGEYWGFLVECTLGASGGGSKLCLIKSSNGTSWSGYDSPILDVATGSWDSSLIYRSSFVIENGLLQGIYTAMGADWHAGYTSHSAVGGSGYSSNVITSTAPGICPESACDPVAGAYISHFTGPDCNGEEYYYTHYFSSDGIRRSWDGGGVAGTILRSATTMSWRSTTGCRRNQWPSGNTLDGFVRIYRACGEHTCTPVTDAYISHYTGPNCDGAEYYYTPYFYYDGVRRSWDGQGLAGVILRRVTSMSYRTADGVCHANAWPNGNTLDDFVRIYRPNTGIIP
jgi:hypothetical protein